MNGNIHTLLAKIDQLKSKFEHDVQAVLATAHANEEAARAAIHRAIKTSKSTSNGTSNGTGTARGTSRPDYVPWQHRPGNEAKVRRWKRAVRKGARNRGKG